MRYLWTISLGFVLTACSEDPVTRYSVPGAETSETIAVSARSVEIRDVSLPSYAASDELHVEDATGALTSSSAVLWADAPERAVSLELARNLLQLTRAQVASEPWPFEESAEARVEVRIERMVAGQDGLFHLSGQYFVANEEAARNHAHLFDVSAPYDPAAGPSAIAAARGDVILQLSRLIARDGL